MPVGMLLRIELFGKPDEAAKPSINDVQQAYTEGHFTKRHQLWKDAVKAAQAANHERACWHAAAIGTRRGRAAQITSSPAPLLGELSKLQRTPMQQLQQSWSAVYVCIAVCNDLYMKAAMM